MHASQVDGPRKAVLQCLTLLLVVALNTVFLLAEGEFTVNKNDLVTVVASAAGLSPLGPYHAMMYGRSLYFDITKAKTELSWQPKYSNNEMFVHSYDWYVKNREMIMNAHGASHHRSAVKAGVLTLVKHLL